MFAPFAYWDQKTVIIGTQRWSTINLDVTTYRDGTTIPEVTNSTTWSNLTTGAWCYYNNDPANGPIYGKLYNWYAVNNTINGGLAPVGQHIPSDAEWTTLSNYLGGDAVAGGKMKTTGTLPAVTGLWQDPNTDATNESGFSGLPGGYCSDTGLFNTQQAFGFWWSSSQTNATLALTRLLRFDYSYIFSQTYPKKYGFSVRCIID